MPEQFANFASSTLNGTISSGALSLDVVMATSFPSSGNFRVLIDNELILVTGVSGTTFTVLRAQEGTSAASHTTGTAVTHIVTAGALSALKTDVLGADATVATDESTSSSSYTDLTTVGPSITLVTGTAVRIHMGCTAYNSVNPGGNVSIAVAVSGATTIAAADVNGCLGHGAFDTNGYVVLSRTFVLSGLTPGSNTFTLQYSVGADTFHFFARDLTVIPV